MLTNEMTKTTTQVTTTPAELNTLLAQAALSEPRRTVPASTRNPGPRAWSRGGNVD